MSKPIHCQCTFIDGPEDIQHIKCALCRSAPKLLEACREALGHFEPICDPRKDSVVLARLEAAIKAAEAI